MPLSQLKSHARQLTRQMLDVLLPSLCLQCRSLVMESQSLCAACWGNLPFISKPLCECCGEPFPHAMAEGMMCASCLMQEPVYDKARAALQYDEKSRGLILSFKHGDQTHLSKLLARLMMQAGAELLHDADVLMPIPLHWRRMLKRRYNQSALLAQSIAVMAEKPVWLDCLRRLRATPSMQEMGRNERRRNVRGAFEVRDAKAYDLKGKKILIIDDVLTSGATVNEAARVLKQKGAAEVYILTAARVCLS